MRLEQPGHHREAGHDAIPAVATAVDGAAVFIGYLPAGLRPGREWAAESALGGIARDALSATCRTFGSVRMQIIWPGSGGHGGDGHR